MKFYLVKNVVEKSLSECGEIKKENVALMERLRHQGLLKLIMKDIKVKSPSYHVREM